MKQGYIGGNPDLRAAEMLRGVSRVALTYEDYTLEPVPAVRRRSRRGLRAGHRPGLRGQPRNTPAHGKPRRHGLAACSWLRVAAALCRHLSQLRGPGQNLQFDRMDGEIIWPHSDSQENWVISLHGLVQTTPDDSDNVPLPDAVAWQWQHAAGVSAGGFATGQSPDVPGVSLDSQSTRGRHGALLRHGKSGARVG
jgi:hypothetical protein